jgi:hypothetical protein
MIIKKKYRKFQNCQGNYAMPFAGGYVFIPGA